MNESEEFCSQKVVHVKGWDDANYMKRNCFVLPDRQTGGPWPMQMQAQKTFSTHVTSDLLDVKNGGKLLKHVTPA
jgi:hypothetical protein